MGTPEEKLEKLEQLKVEARILGDELLEFFGRLSGNEYQDVDDELIDSFTLIIFHLQRQVDILEANRFEIPHLNLAWEVYGRILGNIRLRELCQPLKLVNHNFYF